MYQDNWSEQKVRDRVEIHSFRFGQGKITSEFKKKC